MRRWTRNFNIFEFRYVVIPYNVNRNHWLLFVADVEACMIKALDSMGGKFPRELRALQAYFVSENRVKQPGAAPKQWSLRESDATVPSQGRNRTECGVFMLARCVLSGCHWEAATLSDCPRLRKRMVLDFLRKHIA